MKILLVIIATAFFGAEVTTAGQAVIESDSITQSLLRAVLVSGSNFSYPDEAARQKQAGTCHCTMFLLPNGTTKAVTVTKTSGHPILDDYVRRTLKGYRCKPGTQGPIQWFITFSWPAKIQVVVIRF